MKSATSIPHGLGLTLGESTDWLKFCVNFRWTKVGFLNVHMMDENYLKDSVNQSAHLAIAVGFPFVFPFTVDTGTLSWFSGPLEDLTLLHDLVGAVGDVHLAEVAGRHDSLILWAPGPLAETIGLLAVALSLPLECPLASADAGTPVLVRSDGGLLLLRGLLALLPHVRRALGVLPVDVIPLGVGLGGAPIEPDAGVTAEAVLLALELPGRGAGTGLLVGGLGGLTRLVHGAGRAPGETHARLVGAVISEHCRAPVSLQAGGVSAVAERIP